MFQVIFTEPFIEASNNRHTTPYLDDDVKAIQEDSQLKEAAQAMLKKFTSSHEVEHLFLEYREW